MGRQERRWAVTPCSVSSRHEHAIGDARVKMHVVDERRAEAVQEGGRIAMVVGRAPAFDEPLALFGQAARSTRLLVTLGQTFEIPAIDHDQLFSAPVQQKQQPWGTGNTRVTRSVLSPIPCH